MWSYRITLLSLGITLGSVAWANGHANLPNNKKSSPGAATLPPAAAWKPPLRRLIIKYKEQPNAIQQWSGADRAYALNQSNAKKQLKKPNLHWNHLKSIRSNTHVVSSNQDLSRTEMRQLVQELRKNPDIEYAEVDEWMRSHLTPNDTFYTSHQWSMKAASAETAAVNLPAAWNRTYNGNPINGAGIVVAILDGGYRPHAELTSNLLSGYDFVSADSNFFTANDGDGRDANAEDPGNWNTDSTQCTVSNSSWHGTRVAGIVAAEGNNNNGLIGVAYGAKILPVRVLGVCGGYTSDIAAGIEWAAGLDRVGSTGIPNNPHRAHVINLSLGASENCGTTFQNAITAARNAGSVIVASTGNDYYENFISTPANCSGVIAVTAHTRGGDSATYANTGPGTTISAPGGGYGIAIMGDGSSIYSTSNTGPQTPGADTYAYGNGTSFAAPHVAGVAALIFQARPGVTPAQVQAYLSGSSRSFPAGSYCSANPGCCGSGMLDADAAVLAALSGPPPANATPACAIAAGNRSQADSSSSGGGGGGGGSIDLALLALLCTAAYALRSRGQRH